MALQSSSGPLRGQRAMARLLMAAIVCYQRLLSPWLSGRCRWHPSCSAYGLTALAQHPLPTALGLLGRRLWRCAPWGGSGFDPVPRGGQPAGGRGLAGAEPGPVGHGHFDSSPAAWCTAAPSPACNNAPRGIDLATAR